MDTVCAEAFVHAETVRGGERWWSVPVLGFRLRPFSLWHLFLLEATEHPLATPGRPISLPQLRSAVRMLAARWPQRAAPVSIGTAFRELAMLGRILWEQRRHGLSPTLLREYQAVRVYLEDYRALPVFARSKDAKPAEVHWVLLMVNRLVRAGWSPAEAWDCPLGEAIWHVTAQQELAGNRVRILNETRRAAIEAARNRTRSSN